MNEIHSEDSLSSLTREFSAFLSDSLRYFLKFMNDVSEILVIVSSRNKNFCTAGKESGRTDKTKGCFRSSDVLYIPVPALLG